MSKKVVVYTTNGGGKTIETDAKTWGELAAQLTKTGINPAGMKAADNKKRTYENSEAELPNDLTHMFLLPVKTKSGAGDLSFSEARAFITAALADDVEAAKAHFNQGGKNYTQKSTAALNELIASYKKPKGAKKASATTAKAEPVKKAETKAVAKAKPVAKAIEAAKPERVNRTVAKAKSVTTAPAKQPTKDVAPPKEKKGLVKSTSNGSEIDNIVALLEGLKGYNQGTINKAVMAVLELKVVAEDSIDNSELRRMAQSIARGFNDVKNI